MRKRNLRLIVGTCLAAMCLVAGSAAADPNPPPPPYRDLNGVGDDTTQGVMNLLSNIIVDGTGNKLIASWDSAPAPFEPAVTLTEIPPQPGAAHTLEATVAQNPPGAVQFFQYDPNPGNPPFPVGDPVIINTPPAGPVVTANVGPFTQDAVVDFFAIFYPTDDTAYAPSASITTTIIGP
jgi:hypothetical protein